MVVLPLTQSPREDWLRRSEQAMQRSDQEHAHLGCVDTVARIATQLTQRYRDEWPLEGTRQEPQLSSEQRLAESLQQEMQASESQDFTSVSPEEVGQPNNGGQDNQRPPRKRQFANRTKTGCQ